MGINTKERGGNTMSGISDFLLEFNEIFGEKYSDEEIKKMDINEMLELYYSEMKKVKVKK